MLTRDEIIKQLKIDPAWEPKDEVTDDEWVLYEEVKEEFEDDSTNTSGKKDETLDDDELDELDNLSGDFGDDWDEEPEY